MVKPRLCFTLLYANGGFHLSRNFNLQSVGDFDWLMDNYEFESIARSIDELFIINVSSGNIDWIGFKNTIQRVVKRCFMPVAVGGGIKTMEDAKLLFENGADKVILNSAFFTQPNLISQLVNSYGSQSIVASIDFKRNENESTNVLIEGGKKNTGLDLAAGLTKIVELGAGEIYLTSIIKDGTGNGYDLDALQLAFEICDLPIIASGGADTYDRLAEGIKSGFASAVATAHLFNFMSDGLYETRQNLLSERINLSQWSFEDMK